MWLLTLLWSNTGEFLRLLSEGKLSALLSSSFLKSDANGGVDDRFASIACERTRHSGNDETKNAVYLLYILNTRYSIECFSETKQVNSSFVYWNHARSGSSGATAFHWTCLIWTCLWENLSSWWSNPSHSCSICPMLGPRKSANFLRNSDVSWTRTYNHRLRELSRNSWVSAEK